MKSLPSMMLMFVEIRTFQSGRAAPHPYYRFITRSGRKIGYCEFGKSKYYALIHSIMLIHLTFFLTGREDYSRLSRLKAKIDAMCLYALMGSMS